MSENGRQQTQAIVKSPLHDEHGNFAVGNPGGPGRPKGSLDFATVVRRAAKEHGTTIEDMIFRVVNGLVSKAELGLVGSTEAATAFLERACGVLPREDAASVNVNVGVNMSGPPVPETRELAGYLDDLHEAATELHVVDVTSVDELEELLS